MYLKKILKFHIKIKYVCLKSNYLLQPNSSEIKNPLKQSFCPSQIYSWRIHRGGIPLGIQQLSVEPIWHMTTAENKVKHFELII